MQMADREHRKTALLIMGSTRASRNCPRITQWIAGIGRAYLNCEIVDLHDWQLPDDEPAIPAIGPYAQAHTRAWSEKIKSADAVIFVTPQYNWGYPAALKNAIDHLYDEWHKKAAAIVTYGGHGGGKCSKQLKQVAKGVKLHVVKPAPAIVLPKAVIRENAPFDPVRDFAKHVPAIEKMFANLSAAIGTAPRWWRFFA
jgi:NAD(P)H-dependent FMN reductase